MKRILHTAFLVLFVLSCTRVREEEPFPMGENLPAGVPVMLTIPFGSEDLMQVEVGTKADAGFINESNIHDLYVFIFDKDDCTSENSPKKVYGRYFNFDHRRSSLSELNEHHNECWFVENKSINNSETPTRGAVKISTISRNNVALVVLANVANAVMEMDGEDEIARLNAVEDLNELRGMTVKLEQDIVNRKNLFLMMGTLGYNDGRTISTGSMQWNVSNTLNYNSDYTVRLTPLDAKVKFRVKANSEFIGDVTPVYWQVCRTPNSCHLFPDYNEGGVPEGIYYFDSQQVYFEGKEPDGNDTYYTFCFYMLENRLSPAKQASKYYQRELQNKTISSDDGYEGPSSNTYGTHYVENGDWEYANPNSTYVKFDLILTLKPAGIAAMGADDPSSGMEIGHALTSDAIFTVHLGDFTSSNQPDGSDCFNNYNTERGHSYTYNVTVNNTKSIYTEVISDKENQAGQEGFLLLTDAEMINADAHYEYHQLTFAYRPDMQQEKFSWYVKTPFGEGGPRIIFDEVQNKFTYSAEGLDYLWVKFGINELVDGTTPASWDQKTDPSPWGDVHPYTNRRHKYPGDSHYDPTWEPGQRVADGVPVNYGPSDPGNSMYRMIPDLMDITQLIRYIFWETARETAHRQDANAPASAFIADDSDPATVPVIRFTAFIDEYYYEEHPIEHTVDPDLWRKFVNAQPRELHILSDARQSRDRKSDVILSSHSIIQQSIQTIYNIYSADLHTLWGTEHEDEMRKLTNGWPYWPNDPMGGKKTNEQDDSTPGRSGDFDTEVGKWNGRLNSAYIWDFYSSKAEGGSDYTDRRWNTFMEYNVHNEIPELKAPSGGDNGYQGMAYSCLTRNRDNNGDGIVDRSEIRWYLAACNQLAGMWVGNEALSINARLYMPAQGQWRAHIMSSTDRRVSWAEEGGGATEYNWDFWDNRHTWETIGDAAAGESVRCLRNIGTYTDEGTVKDISYAPYDYEIEPYFTKEGPEPEGPFTFYFDRLNPKSIRQLSETELPYADQFSLYNCVYLKFETQSRRDNVGDTEADSFNLFNTVDTYNEKSNPNGYPTIYSINPEISQLGHNPYCPPGYRFPNHSEMLLMSLYLPQAYFEKDKDNNGYGSSVRVNIPTRTYYDRGVYGDNRTGMEPAEINRERGKTGWGYTSGAHKQSCLENATIINHSRCVRDVDMTGHIDGDIQLPSDILYHGDPIQLKYSFYSSGASFVSASLLFCYTDGNDLYHELDIPLKASPSGMQFVASQNYTLPTFAEMGLSTDKDKADCKFKFTLRNTAGSRTIEHPVSLVCSYLTHCALTLPSQSDPDKGMPVRVSIGIRDNEENAKITNVTLHWKASDGSWQTTVLEDGSNNLTTFAHDAYLRSIIGEDAWATEDNRDKEYQFYVTASCSDGTGYISETLANQILLLNIRPNADGAWSIYPDSGEYHQWNDPWWQEGIIPWTNPNNANDWYNTLPSSGTNKDYRQKNVICNTLPGMQIANLNFPNGDFIEAGLDVSQCVFVRTVEGKLSDSTPKNQTVGMDNIFGIAPSEAALNWGAGSFLCYYPAHTDATNTAPATDKLQVDALDINSNKFGKKQVGTIDSSILNLKLCSDGFSWNGNLLASDTNWDNKNANYNAVIPNLLTKSTLWVGAIEGKHLTRALYNFIRVVRVKEPAVTPVPRD